MTAPPEPGKGPSSHDLGAIAMSWDNGWHHCDGGSRWSLLMALTMVAFRGALAWHGRF